LAGAGGVSPRGGVSRKRGVPTGSARSRSDGIGTVGTDEAAGAGVAAVGGPGRGRGTAGGAALAAVAVRRRVRVEMRSQDGFTVGGIGEPGEAGADVVGPVVSTASVPCVGLL